MNTSPVQSEMNPQQAAVAEQLTRWGYEWLWANGKGGGFWIKGIGYQGLEDCVALINDHIADFDIEETNRLRIERSQILNQPSANPTHAQSLELTRSFIERSMGDLDAVVKVARFTLPALPAPRSDLNGMKNRLSKLKRELASAGDRRDWDGSNQTETQIEALEAEIKRLEAAAQPRQLAELKREIADLEQERQTTTDGAKIARIDQRLSDLYREQTGQRPQPAQPNQTVEVEGLRAHVDDLLKIIETAQADLEGLAEQYDVTECHGVGVQIRTVAVTIGHKAAESIAIHRSLELNTRVQ